MSQEFSRSLVAQGAALAMIESAREHGYLSGAMVAVPTLAEAEKSLFVKMLSRFAERTRSGVNELATDEISSLFTFVYAKAAEAVTSWFNGQECNFELLGLLDGKVPIYAADDLTGYFKKLNLPGDCAQAYLDWHAANANSAAFRAFDPLLPLFEALKWTFRISCTVAVEKLEQHGRRAPGE